MQFKVAYIYEIPTILLKTLIMKAIKIVIISIVIILIFSLALYKTDKISIEGVWTPEKIILNGQQIYPSHMDSIFIGSGTKITINEWTDSLYISNRRDTIRASIAIKNKSNGRHQIRLSSRENSLNGNFDIKIDTLHLGPLAYEILVKLQSSKTLIYFHREVRLKPWKPELPRRGQI